MPAALQTPARPAPAPATPTPPAIADGLGEIPQTPAQYAAMIARRTELQSQLQWLQSQRSSVVAQLNRRINTEANRTGLESQLQVLDRQIMQIDGSIAQTSQLIAQAPASALPGIRMVPPPYANQSARRDNMTAGVFLTAITIVFVLFPLTLGFVRRMGRGSVRGLPPRFEETPARLDRIEQALDTVAVEVERISEGQRFMTKIMTERAAAQPAKALGAGERPFEPVRVSEEDQSAVRVPRSPSTTPH